MIKMWIEENYESDEQDVCYISKDAGEVVKRSPYAAALVNVLSDHELAEALREAFEAGKDSVDWDRAGGLEYDGTADDYLKEKGLA